MERGDPDVALMLAFRSGDTGAFDALFRRWTRPVLRYLTRMLRDASAAEEVAQETFLRVHRARAEYAPEARFSTWLYTIATRLALNELRRRRRGALVPEPEEGAETRAFADPAPPPDVQADLRRRVAGTEEALAALPERQRAALWLVAVEGLAYEEAAQALETSVASIKSLVHRARCALVDATKARSTE